MSDREFELVQEAGEESFPASDPPAFTPVTGAGHHFIAAGQRGDRELLRERYRNLDFANVDEAAVRHIRLVQAYGRLGDWDGSAALTVEALDAIRGAVTSTMEAVPQHRREFEQLGSQGTASDARDWLRASIDRLLGHHLSLEREAAELLAMLDRVEGPGTSEELDRQVRVVHHRLEEVLALEFNVTVRAAEEPPPALD